MLILCSGYIDKKTQRSCQSAQRAFYSGAWTCARIKRGPGRHALAAMSDTWCVELRPLWGLAAARWRRSPGVPGWGGRTIVLAFYSCAWDCAHSRRRLLLFEPTTAPPFADAFVPTFVDMRLHNHVLLLWFSVLPWKPAKWRLAFAAALASCK